MSKDQKDSFVYSFVVMNKDHLASVVVVAAVVDNLVFVVMNMDQMALAVAVEDNSLVVEVVLSLVSVVKSKDH